MTALLDTISTGVLGRDGMIWLAAQLLGSPYRHTFAARTGRIGLLRALTADAPAGGITCPCGQEIHFIHPFGERDEVLTCPRCHSWHSLQWRGE